MILFHAACKHSSRSFRMKHIFYNTFMVNWQVLIILQTFSGLKTTLQVNTTQAESFCSLGRNNGGRNTASWGHFHISLSSPNNFHVQLFHSSFLLTQKPSEHQFNWLMFLFSVHLPSREWQDFPGCPVQYVWNILPNSARPAFFKSCITIFY